MKVQCFNPDCYSSLSRHLDFFEMVRNEDDSELAKRFDMVSKLELPFSFTALCFLIKLLSVPVCLDPWLKWSKVKLSNGQS